MSPARNDPQQLRRALTALADLRAGVASASSLPAPRKAELLAEIDEIGTLLRSRDKAPPAEESAEERLERLALEFEASHPDAAALVNRVTNLLASMGI